MEININETVQFYPEVEPTGNKILKIECADYAVINIYVSDDEIKELITTLKKFCEDTQCQ
jgi:Holliday junction resolvase